MPISENDIDLIDNYLKGNCSDAEKKQFEDRIKSDEAFNEEYLQLKSLSTAFEQLELKDELKQLESKIRGAEDWGRSAAMVNMTMRRPKEKTHGINKTKWISIAAGIVLIIGGTFTLSYLNNNSDVNNKMKYGTPLEVPVPEDSSAIDDSIPGHIKEIFNNSNRNQINYERLNCDSFVKQYTQRIERTEYLLNQIKIETSSNYSAGIGAVARELESIYNISLREIHRFCSESQKQMLNCDHEKLKSLNQRRDTLIWREGY